MRRLEQLLLGSGLAVVLALGIFALASEARAAKPSCNCPPDYAPVWCKKGKGAARYANLCLAQCDGATDCVPIIILPPS